MKLKEIVKLTGGTLISGRMGRGLDFAGFSTDTRTIKNGDFFIALKGPKFDGNMFVKDAFKKGASCVMVSDNIPIDLRSDKIVIHVKDVFKALRDMASGHRKKFNLPVVAITGSNGKTTTKEMISSVLSTRYNVLKNKGTENNHIGVPMTLLRLNSSHEICVLELGTNHKGEIAALADIARPDIAVITNIGLSHLEFLQSLDGVYKEKIEVLKFLNKKNNVVVLNGDDKYLSKVKSGPFRIIKYGFKRSGDLYAAGIRSAKTSQLFVVNDRMVFEINMCGAHNILNALCAIAIGDHFGISYRLMREALIGCVPAKMRMDIRSVRGVDIINDSYNSNPLSMKSALDALKTYPAKARWVVSADMLELGKHAVRFHKMIGANIARSNVDGLLTFGDMSKHTLAQALESGMPKKRLWHCTDRLEIAKKLKSLAGLGDAILLKGSRSMKMEEVVNNYSNLKD